MAGESSYIWPTGGHPVVVVVGQQFMAPYPVYLTISRKNKCFKDNYKVTDSYGNIIFKVKSESLSLRDRHILFDAAGYPIVSLHEKFVTLHGRWKAFRGDSHNSSDSLFSIKETSALGIDTDREVFLATNTSEKYCDFKIKGSWFEKLCTIYAGNSSTVIAQMHKKHDLNFDSIVLGHKKFSVTVYPHVDYAFIIALLLVILEDVDVDSISKGIDAGLDANN